MEKKKEIQDQLLEIALSDINVAWLLHNNSEYGPSVFYFQQATEKAFKAFGVLGQFFDADKLQKISHYHLDEYWKVVAAKEAEVASTIKTFETIAGVTDHEVYKNLKIEEYRDTLSAEKELGRKLKSLDLVNMEHDDLIDILEQIEEIEDELSKIRFRPPKNSHELLVAGLEKAGEWYSKFNTSAAQEMKEASAAVKTDEEREILLLVIYYYQKTACVSGFIAKVLFWCALITKEHTSLARYPKNGIDPLEFYTKKLPLVKFLPDYLDLLEKATRMIIKLKNGKYLPAKLKALSEAKPVPAEVQHI